MTCLESENFILMIDALDECQEDERRQLVKAIGDFYRTSRNDQNLNLKFLLTSRPYGAIIEDFRELEAQMPTIQLSGDGENESAEISGEIHLGIKKRVHDIRIRKGLNNDDEELLERKLTEMRNRTYLWVALTMDYIRDLDGFTKGKVRETVFPETVDDAYDKILNRSKDQPEAKRLLHIVLAAKIPLSVEELGLAMALKVKGQPLDDILESIESPDRFKTALRSICGLMLVVVNDRVYLLHQTVEEFLVQQPSTPVELLSSLSWKHTLSAIESHKTLAKIFVWHMFAASVESNLDVLLRYSAICWLDHFREAHFRHEDEMPRLGYFLCVPGSKLYNTLIEAIAGEMHLPEKRTGLILAARHGLSSVVQEFLEHISTEVNSPDAQYGRSPLSWARGGHDTVVNLLLDAKADIDSKDLYGRTALSFAAEMGRDTVVSLLLDARVDIDSKDSYGYTSLSWAAQYGRAAVVGLLSSVGEMDAK